MSSWVESWDFRDLPFPDPHFVVCLLSRPSIRYEAHNITFSSSTRARPPYPGQHYAMLPLPRPNTARKGHFLHLSSCAPPFFTRCTSPLHITSPLCRHTSLLLVVVQNNQKHFFLKKILNWTLEQIHLSVGLADWIRTQNKFIYLVKCIYLVRLKHRF